MNKILLVDDDTEICMLLNRFLLKQGYEVAVAHKGKAALEIINQQNIDLVLCDFRLEDMDGSEVLESIKQSHRNIPVIIMTGYSDVRTAVNIMKMGGFDYVTKPLLPQEILLTIKRALEAGQSDTEHGEESKTADNRSEGVNGAAKLKPIKTSNKYIFGKSDVFKNILDQIRLVAPTNFSVIIYGESGSGKESIAYEIHHNSQRSTKPFVAIDCGALSKELAASELFGHEKGSFTGAVGQKIGSFEVANGGTIFLDEIANLSYEVQVALLRVIQERKMKRVGGIKDIDLDVRIIIASNERLSEAAKKGKFREDLYHRFNEFSIELPPLRTRLDDIELFANFFLERTNKELNKSVKGFSKAVLDIFKTYPWPGNLRELNNVVKRATLLTSEEYVEISSLPFEITHYNKLSFESEPLSDNVFKQSEEKITRPILPNENGMKYASIDAEFHVILDALKKCNYNKSKAAKLLDIDRKTLYNKMKLYKEFTSDLE